MSEHGIKNLSDEQYRMSDGVSQSELKYLIPPKTPKHYRYYKDHPQLEPTPAQRMGTLVHTCLLRPDVWQESIVVKPEGMKFTTIEGKEWKLGQNGKTIITLEEKVRIQGMIDSLYSNSIAKKLLKDATTEASVFAEDSQGILRKARIDAIPNGGNTLIDIKTCADASLDAFNGSIYKYSRYVQAAWYLDIMEFIGQGRDVFLFVAVESEPPFCTAVYPIDVLSVEIGQKEYKGALAVLKACQNAGAWPGYPENLETYCGLPMYCKAMREGAS